LRYTEKTTLFDLFVFIIKELLNHAGKNSFMARVITFNDGMNIFNQKSNKRYVRAVVGNTCTPEWIDNNDGTITDQCTGFIWEKEA
jgi:hypothetical protein